MKSKDKKEEILAKIVLVNSTILSNKDFAITFASTGGNDYRLILKNQQFKFHTYGDVLSCLNLIITFFSK